MDDTNDQPTGWSARGLAAVAMAALAALHAFIVLYGERGGAAEAQGVWAFVTETLLGHAAGGFVAGWLLAGLFGRRGVLGWPLTLLGAVIASLLAGLLGGLIGSLPALLAGNSLAQEAVLIGAGALVGPLAIGGGATWLLGVWLVAIAVIHLGVRRLRQP